MGTSESYTNPVLDRNSPDPGVLALPDGSGTLKEVSIVLLHLRSLMPNFMQYLPQLTYPKNAVLLRPDKTISTPQAMPWSLLPTLRTNQMAILHYHYIFPPTWYPLIQHQQAKLKSNPGQLDSEGPCVSNRGMAIVGRGEYVGAGDPFCQWHFCRLLYRLVQRQPDKGIMSEYIMSGHRGKRATMDGPQSSRWSCGFNLRITLGTLHRS